MERRTLRRLARSPACSSSERTCTFSDRRLSDVRLKLSRPWTSNFVTLKLKWRRWWFYPKKVAIDVPMAEHANDTEFTITGEYVQLRIAMLILIWFRFHQQVVDCCDLWSGITSHEPRRGDEAHCHTKKCIVRARGQIQGRPQGSEGSSQCG